MIYYVANKTITIKNEDEVKYLFLTKKVHEWLKNTKIIGLDTETEGFDAHTKGLLLYQFGDFNTQFVINAVDFPPEEFREYLESEDKIFILQNAKFDLRFFYKQGIYIKNIRDTFINELIITQGIRNRNLGLDDIVLKYCNYQLDKSVRGVIHQGIDEKVVIYSAEDVKFLELVYNKQLELIKETNQEYLLNEIEIPFQHVLAEMEWNGLKLNPTKWLKLEKQNKKIQEGLVKELNTYISTLPGIRDYPITKKGKQNIFAVYTYTTRGDEEITISKVNWSSDEHVKRIFKFIGIPIEFYDTKEKKKKESVQIKHIEKYEKDFVILTPYINLSKVTKLISTYGKDMVNYAINPLTQRVHTTYFPIIDTGRTSCGREDDKTAPNMQTMPSKGGYRECFEAAEGYTYVISDYPSQEPKCTASKANEEALIDFFNNGDGDIHSFVASKMFSAKLGREIKIDKDNLYLPEFGDLNLRQVGKVLNLKLDYGGRAFTVKDELGCSEKEAQAFIDILASAFPKKAAYFKRVKEEVIENGYIITNPITNRKININGFNNIKAALIYFKENKRLFWDKYKAEEAFKARVKELNFFQVKASIERNAMNYPSQGTAADISKLAGILIQREFRKRFPREDAKIVGFYHDEWHTEVKEEIAEECGKIVEKCMDEAGLVFCPEIPFKCKAFISKVWKK